MPTRQNRRQNHSAKFKVTVALTAVKGDRTTAELAITHSPNLRARGLLHGRAGREETAQSLANQPAPTESAEPNQQEKS